MRLGTARKGPNDILDYDVELQDWLTASDTITQAEASAEAGLTVDSVGVFEAEQLVKVWLSGGTVHETYEVTVTMVTSEGRQIERCFSVRIIDC